MIIVIDNADTLSDFSYKSDTIPVTSSSISSGRTEDTIFRSTSGDSIMRDISQSKIISIGNNDITINNVIVAAFVMTWSSSYSFFANPIGFKIDWMIPVFFFSLGVCSSFFFFRRWITPPPALSLLHRRAYRYFRRERFLWLRKVDRYCCLVR